MLTLGLRNIVRTRNMCGKLLPCAYSGTRLESIFWFFCVFTCISLELQVRTGSDLETRYRYHPRSQSYQKKISAAHNNGP